MGGLANMWQKMHMCDNKKHNIPEKIRTSVLYGFPTIVPIFFPNEYHREINYYESFLNLAAD